MSDAGAEIKMAWLVLQTGLETCQPKWLDSLEQRARLRG